MTDFFGSFEFSVFCPNMQNLVVNFPKYSQDFYNVCRKI